MCRCVVVLRCDERAELMQQRGQTRFMNPERGSTDDRTGLSVCVGIEGESDGFSSVRPTVYTTVQLTVDRAMDCQRKRGNFTGTLIYREPTPANLRSGHARTRPPASSQQLLGCCWRRQQQPPCFIEPPCIVSDSTATPRPLPPSPNVVTTVGLFTCISQQKNQQLTVEERRRREQCRLTTPVATRRRRRRALEKPRLRWDR